MYIVSIITATVAVISVIVSMLANRRNIIVNGFIQNRMEWIKEVRGLLIEFVDAYRLGNYENMVILKEQISLYMRNDREVYKRLLDKMQECINSGATFNQKLYDQMIVEAQYTLAQSWERIRLEVKGNPFSSEKRIKKIVYKKTEDIIN